MRSGLIDYKTTINEKLITACALGKLDECMRYIAKGADINYKQIESGNTPAHYAAANSKKFVFQYLCNLRNFEPTKNVNKYTYLHMAAAFGDLEMVKFIVEYGYADLNDTTSEGKTALQLSKSEDVKAYLTQKTSQLGEEKVRDESFRNREDSLNDLRPLPVPNPLGTNQQNNDPTVRQDLQQQQQQNQVINPPNDASFLAYSYFAPSKIDEIAMELNKEPRTQYEVLDLTKISEEISDENLKRIIDSFPNIKELNLSTCSKISDAAIEYLAPKLKNLTSLHLATCTNITDNALKTLAEQKPELLLLNIHFCKEITDAGILSLANNMPNLSSLDISSTSITNQAIDESIIKMQNLSSLAIKRTKITDAGILSIAKNMPNLSSLDISSTSITNRGISFLTADAEKLPKLKYIDTNECKEIKNQTMLTELSNKLGAKIISPNGKEILPKKSFSDRAREAKANISQSCIIA